MNEFLGFGLDDPQKKIFEAIVKYCAVYSNLIPLSFVLGFYVSIVMTRWLVALQQLKFFEAPSIN